MSLLAFFVLVAGTAALTALATPAFAVFAERRGLVVAPRQDRWHRRATPLLGGAAIAVGVLVVLVMLLPAGRTAETILVAGAAAFALGLLDDFRGLAPTTKLVGQMMVAAMLVFGGIRVELVDLPPVSFLLTAFWVVAIMNALNLMDNMDGLAAGIAAIAAAILGLTTLTREPLVALVAGTTAGAALGFLVHNFHPARVFMGDAGSLLLGFMLATTALLHTTASVANVGLAVIGPIAVLALPIFDTVFVTVARRLAGRPVGKGGRDHTSHRLAALGLSDRDTVLLLYVVALGLAAVAAFAEAISGFALALFALSVAGLTLFGIVLHEVDVYGPSTGQAAPLPPDTGFARTLFVRGRFAAEVGLDLILLTVAYYVPYLIRFEGLAESQWLYLFTNSVPVVIGIQLAVLVVLRVYRTLWRYLGIGDAVRIVRAVAVGTGLSAIAVFLLTGFEGYSRAVFVFDFVLASMLVVGSRSFTVWLRHWFAMRPRTGELRVLIVGATDTGAVALRLLSRLGRAPHRAVGFLDDDPGKRYRQVGGVPIVGTIEDLSTAIATHRVDLVVIALDDADAAARVRAACLQRGVQCRQFSAPV